LGAQSALAGTGWTGPLALWTGIFAGPVAWTLDVLVSYPLVQWACAHDRTSVLGLINLATLLTIAAGAWVSWRSLQAVPADLATDGGGPLQRARFMALLGLSSGALFTLVVIASEIARWVLDGCG
jgi:hypothetical protein